MPTQWDGTFEDRFARLERAGRRCDANSRNCTRSAVEEYTLLPADGHFNALPDAERVTKKCCGYHRPQFLTNGVWVCVANRQLRTMGPQPQRYEQLRRERATDSGSGTSVGA